MPGKLRRTPRAELDLIEIWNYISADNLDAADKLVLGIDETCQLLGRQPEIGRTRPDLGSDIRSFAHRRYLILYRIVADGMEIVRVVHGARNLPDLF
jgi:toxin ParE1/3/4